VKTGLAPVVFLLVLTSSVAAQSVCREAKNKIVERRLGFTIHSVSWLSTHGLVKATATIPANSKPSDPVVFSFSTLVGSQPEQSVDMIPLAMELAEQGRPTLVIERKLTWPEIDQSVGTMEADVICAEQWLSRHATTTPNHWRFVGPNADAPKPEQFDELGDKNSMTFWAIFPVGDRGEDTNTENLLRSTSPIQKWLLTPFLD
jgi:hypothetical protein